MPNIYYSEDLKKHNKEKRRKMICIGATTV